jgi:hypothetical protein
MKNPNVKPPFIPPEGAQLLTILLQFCFQVHLAPLHHGNRGGCAHAAAPPGRAVSVDPVRTRVESAYGLSA